MQTLEERKIYCPYCGEPIAVLLDCSQDQQDYVEDCQVCCRPIVFQVTVDINGEPDVQVFREDE